MNLTWPNLLSALRVALIPLFIIALIDGRPGRALILFGLASLTDLLDGFIARFYHQQSVLGAYLDPMADKLLLTSAYIMLAVPNLVPGVGIPIWLTVLVIARDVIIVVVALIIYLALGITKFPPSRISKWNTAFQLIAVFLVLLSGLSTLFELPARTTLYIVALLTVTSGLEYAYRFIYRAQDLTDRSPSLADDSLAPVPEKAAVEEKRT